MLSLLHPAPHTHLQQTPAPLLPVLLAWVAGALVEGGRGIMAAAGGTAWKPTAAMSVAARVSRPPGDTRHGGAEGDSEGGDSQGADLPPLSLPSQPSTVSQAEWDGVCNVATLGAEAAVVHLAIDALVQSLDETDDGQDATVADDTLLAAVARLVHALFLANPVLLRVVHYQGYDPRLVRALVEAVPSMHACSDFVRDLAHGDDPQRSVQFVFLFDCCCFFCLVEKEEKNGKKIYLVKSSQI
jgi:hypothetical protein